MLPDQLQTQIKIAAVRVAANTEQALTKVLQALGIQEYAISPRKTLEVAECLLKDLLRLVTAQDNQVADTKYAAYWSFWIRKVKPIREAWITVNEERLEITDINERVAVELAVAILKMSKKHMADLVRGRCKSECDGSECIERFLARYFSFSNNVYSEYLVYSLGHRTFGPHHLCAVLDAILFASCRDPGGSSLL